MKYRFGFLIILTIFSSASVARAAISEATFNSRIDQVESVYGDWAKAYSAKLVVKRHWSKKSGNGSASDADKIQVGEESAPKELKWVVNVWGENTGTPYKTGDTLSLWMCHEMGHLIGGFPFSREGYGGLPNDGRTAGSAEGQADYFATQVCLKKLWAPELAENRTFRGSVLPETKALCDRVYSSDADQNLCYRIVHASLDAQEDLLVSRAESPADHGIQDYLDDSKPAGGSLFPKSNLYEYPSLACRLTTFIRGALCPKSFSDFIIPGTDFTEATAEKRNSKAIETAASRYACTRGNGFPDGARPPCWFRERR